MDTTATVKPRTRCSWSPEERAEWVALFEHSGQSLSQFCRDNDLPVPTLSAWRAQLREPATEEDTGFIEVPLTQVAAVATAPAQRVSPSIQLRIGAVELSVAAGTDPAWLATLIRSLQV